MRTLTEQELAERDTARYRAVGIMNRRLSKNWRRMQEAHFTQVLEAFPDFFKTEPPKGGVG